MEEICCNYGSFEEFSSVMLSEDLLTDIVDYETQRFGSVDYVTKDYFLNLFDRPLVID